MTECKKKFIAPKGKEQYVKTSLIVGCRAVLSLFDFSGLEFGLQEDFCIRFDLKAEQKAFSSTLGL